MSSFVLPNKQDIINQSMAVQAGQLKDQCKHHIRVVFKSNNKYQQKNTEQTNSLQVCQFSRCLQESALIAQGITFIDLDDEKEIFTIGKLEKEIIDLQQGLKAEIYFNEVVISEHVLSYIHLEVNYRSLKKLNNQYDEDATIKSIISKIIATQALPFKIMESYFLKNRKIRISDISKKLGCPTLIQITQNCEQKILKDEQTYIIGQEPKLVVKKNFSSLELFFQRYSVSSNQNDFVFDALFKLEQKVEFLGVDNELAELFMQVQYRAVNKNSFCQKLEEENYKLQIQLQNCLQKSCIWIIISNSSFKVQNFLLVADVKIRFTFGRSRSNDLIYTSNQVSRFQGQIEYNSELKTWKIIDGYLDEIGGWQYSKYGIWLEMKPELYYFVDLEQKIKLGNHIIQFMLKEKEQSLLEFEDSETIDDFINTLLTSDQVE